MAILVSEERGARGDWCELAELFEPSVVVLSAENELANVAKLTQGEAALVSGALDKRRREFATGRVLARHALGRLGRAEVEILRGPRHEPNWPAGITGSISHCDTRAVVAVAERSRTGTLGIDIEHRIELDRKLWSHVLLAEEIADLERDFEPFDRGRRALLLFSAKEAFYKAQYPWTERFLDFHAVRVRLDPASLREARGGFQCVLQVPIAGLAAVGVVRGRYLLDRFPRGELVTAVCIEEADRCAAAARDAHE